jgi:hypothetical protein
MAEEATKTTASPEGKKFLEYKGHPLVRKGDTIYYGSLADPYVVMLKISSTKELKDLQLSDKVLVMLMSTDQELSPLDRVQQRCERHGLFNAVDIASVWLERALKKAA